MVRLSENFTLTEYTKSQTALRQGIETINDDTLVVYLNTTTIMRLDSNEFNWDTDQVSKYGISFACSEAL